MQQNVVIVNLYKYMIFFQMESYQTTQKFLVITYINSHWSPQMQSDIENVASDLTLHWIYCNVYTVCTKSVQKKIEKLVQRYYFLKRYTIMKRKRLIGKNLAASFLTYQYLKKQLQSSD